MKKGVKALIITGVFVGIIILSYFFLPLNTIVNLDPITLDIIFMSTLMGFAFITFLLQEFLGVDKEARKKIKEAKEI